MTTSTQDFDVVVIGGGPSGEHAVDRCCRGGLTAAIIESELVGGECSYWACMPSKALLRPGQVLAETRGVSGARQAVTGELDANQALARRNWVTDNWDDAGQARWLNEVGATLVRGHGRLVGKRLVTVETAEGTRTLRANRAVILATGSKAAVPPIDGLASTRLWDSRDVTSAQQVPDSLVIIGGGVVGVEMAQAWRRLGCHDVTIVEGSDRLLANAEPFASAILTDAFQQESIKVLTSAKVTSVHRDSPTGPVTMTVQGQDPIQAQELLVAVGRHPRTDDLGVDAVGLQPGRYIDVEENMHVAGVDGHWLFAIGDINGRALLTHVGKYQARVAVASILGRLSSAADGLRAVPNVIFTDPAIGSVGLTEQRARASLANVKITKVDTNSIAAASIYGESVPGACQLVIDGNLDCIVGATFCGPGIEECVHAATVAIVGKIPMQQLFHAIPCFPSLSEVWLTLVESYLEGKAT